MVIAAIIFITANSRNCDSKVPCEVVLHKRENLSLFRFEYPNTIVLAISTKGKPVPFHVAIQPSRSNGLTEVSFVKCEQVLTVAKERLVKKLGSVDDKELQQVNRAVRLVLEVE